MSVLLPHHSLSFEFFPPKTAEGMQTLQGVQAQLNQLSPEFFSVTYGAGGSTQDATRQTVLTLQGLGGAAVAPHLSCIGASESGLRQLLQDYRSSGVTRIVALRGDLPSGMGPSMGSPYRYAIDLVRFMRQQFGDQFAIEVAAYPEMHPQAASMQQDIQHFIDKAQAGADRAITQYFYNGDAYFDFVEQVRRRGCDIPIIPGMMPITQYARLSRFSDACGAEIPRWIRKRLESYADDHASIYAFGLDLLSDLCERLLQGGAPGLHFYTLNRADASTAIVQRLRSQ